MLVEIFAIFLVFFCAWHWQRTARERNLIEKFPGPKAYPIVGNLTKMRKSNAEFFADLLEFCVLYAKDGSPFRFLLGKPSYISIIILNDPKDFEIILGSNKEIDKGIIYDTLFPWLGTGLLTSTGAKWRSRRKILTPCFHYSILDEFLPVFQANGKILISKLEKHIDGSEFDIHKYVTLCALDNICETAMGVKINAQNESESEYVKAIRQLSSILMHLSIIKPWLRIKFLFDLSKCKPLYDKSLHILHTTTRNVIRKRKEEITKERELNENSKNEFGLKKRLAFLDMLIESTFNGTKLSDEDIREEVDTFMFEGHDTVSAGLSFVIWCLCWNQDCQEKAYQELQEVFPDSEDVSIRKLNELKYLEKVIKESLRLYPSVPIIFRDLHEDMLLSGGLIAPKGSTLCLSVFTSQRNSNFWPDPLKFDPERFSPENTQGRHPYAYVPFSAGSRNCIGQKFAMLEMKSVISRLLRVYKFLPGTENPNLTLAMEVILVSTNDVPVKIVKRE